MLWISTVIPGGMDRRRGAAYMPRMNIGTMLFTLLHGKRIGTDAVGNVYYEERSGRRGLRRRRWVVYRGGPAEPSRVTPEWHAWLHYTTEAPLPTENRRAWQKPHQANLTGTVGSYRPAGHDYVGGQRARATGDYEAWTPGT